MGKAKWLSDHIIPSLTIWNPVLEWHRVPNKIAIQAIFAI